ncbi:hypothetical protein SDC9_113146 [bioreactor metagenome]|uniref:Uncharacterized protein n=1 Tax=bioreactor metagenome TaxID=1076179 RepID=A0A645BLA2_9ZZZZ
MCVKQIQFIEIHDAVNHRTQRDIIRLILKEWVSLDIDFMEKNIGICNVQTCRKRRTDEVNLITFVGKRHSEFCGYDSASAVGWVTEYSDFHEYVFLN